MIAMFHQFQKNITEFVVKHNFYDQDIGTFSQYPLHEKMYFTEQM